MCLRRFGLIVGFLIVKFRILMSRFCFDFQLLNGYIHIYRKSQKKIHRSQKKMFLIFLKF